MSNKNTMKPSYISRRVQAMQKTASELAKKNEEFFNEQTTLKEWQAEELKKSSFSNLKTSAAKRREESANKFNLFKESLGLLIANAAYQAMPVENKEELKINEALSAQPEAFLKLIEAVNEYINGDEAIKTTIGDRYTRCKSLNFGTKGEQIPSEMAAITIAAAVSPIRPDTSSFNANVSFNNYIDTLTKYGATSEEDKLSPEEILYENFVNALSENVEEKVVLGLRKEAEEADINAFLSEGYEKNSVSSVGNKNIARKIKPTVFKEVFKTVSFLNKDSGFPQEMVMQEAVAQYTLLETLNTLDLIGKTNEEIIADLIKKRKQKN